MQRSSVFTVENITDLLTAYYGYFNLSEEIHYFVGSFPSHRILCGLCHLGDLLSDLSPLYHIETEEYTRVLKSSDISLIEKALLIMDVVHII